MKLYVVRHGETIENANNCLVGRINSPLTSNGIDQAKKVREYFEENGTDVEGMSDDELEEALEVFPIPDGTYLIVEG